MRDLRTDLWVWATALAASQVWLERNEYCDCALQKRVVANRLRPFLECFKDELNRRTSDDLDLVARKLAVHLFLAHSDLARALHKQGASAALPRKDWDRYGISPGC